MDALVGLGIILLFVTVTSIPSLIIGSGQDTNKPIVDITSPNPCEDSPGSKQVIVQGTASDKESGIEKVDVFAHTFPFNNQFPYELAERVNSNWSNWKKILNVTENEPYRISARATDREGNENWDEVTIGMPSDSCNNIQ
jgi:hypothetical protein